MVKYMSQSKASIRIDVYKRLLRNTEKEYHSFKDEMKLRLESLEERLQDELAQKKLILEDHSTQEDRLKSEHAEHMRSMERAYKAEHARLLNIHAAEIQARRECLTVLNSLSSVLESRQEE